MVRAALIDRIQGRIWQKKTRQQWPGKILARAAFREKNAGAAVKPDANLPKSQKQ